MASSVIEEHPFGISWVMDEALQRTAHALVDDGRVWLVDPIDQPEAIERASALGEPAAVLQLLDRHNRDCETIAKRLGIPHRRVPEELADAPFRVVPIVRQRFWREVALWWEQQSTLVVAEAVGTAPLFAVGPGEVGVHPMLRLIPPRKQLRDFRPEHLLVGHGHSVNARAAVELGEALERARRDLPRMLRKLPTAARG